jgi:hypothetical protein
MLIEKIIFKSHKVARETSWTLALRVEEHMRHELEARANNRSFEKTLAQLVPDVDWKSLKSQRVA